MNFITATLLYLLLSRLAIVTAGIVSMVIGYRLFCRGIGSSDAKAGRSSIESSIGGLKLSVKDAAPGTCFALFGAVLISVALIESSPSVAWETARKWQASTGAAASSPAEATETTKLQMRGEGESAGSITALTTLGRELESRGKTAEAERAYRDAVTAMAEPMNDLAWIYFNSGKARLALPLANLAVELRPDEERYADTLTKLREAAK